jgi:hypothetical protein
MELKTIIEKVKNKFNADEIVPSALFIESKEDKQKCGILPLAFNGEYEKEQARRLARKIVQRIKPDKYFFISEAWTSKDPSTKPSEAEDKQEIVHIVEYNKDMTQKFCIMPIIRTNKKPKLGKPDIQDRQEGFEIKRDRWNFFLEDD